MLHTHPVGQETGGRPAMPDRHSARRCCAFMVQRNQSSIDVAEDDGLFGAGLARQKFPEQVELLDDLPRTALENTDVLRRGVGGAGRTDVKETEDEQMNETGAARGDTVRAMSLSSRTGACFRPSAKHSERSSTRQQTVELP